MKNLGLGMCSAGAEGLPSMYQATAFLLSSSHPKYGGTNSIVNTEAQRKRSLGSA